MRIYACDVGSIKKGNFAWATTGSSDIGKLVKSVVKDIEAGVKVSLGFECPLFIPCPENQEDIGSARDGEEDRAYTASPAACATITGLSELAWVLSRIHKECPEALATTRWNEFVRGDAQLLIWEAFISGSDKGKSHIDDAVIAAQAFEKRLEAIERASVVTCENPVSFAGMLILWSGMSDDFTLVNDSCLVLKA